MSIVYRIYSNGGSGGPVDYSTIVATVSAPPWTGSALATPSDTTFAVRAYDTVLGLEDLNRDVITRVVLDSSGNNITGIPLAPLIPSARPVGTTSIQVEFGHHPGLQPKPTGFKIWVTAGGSVNYAASPAATIPYPSYGGRLKHLSTTITGLTAGTAYSVGVRAYNAVGIETNTQAVAITTAATAPAPVTGLVVGSVVTPVGPAKAILGSAP
jgi:hypothetical protein